MEVANIMLALAGDLGQTLQKSMVTPSEAAVLRIIHGDDAVFDIEPVGTVDRTHRTERARLVGTYGQMIDGERRAPAVERLFPGAAARVFETFAELELPEEMYKAKERVGAGTTAAERFEAYEQSTGDVGEEVVTPLAPDPLDHDGDGKKGGSKKGRKKAEAPAEPAPAPAPAADISQPDDLGDPTGALVNEDDPEDPLFT